MPLSLRSQSWFRAEVRFPGAFGAWGEGHLTAPAPCSRAQFNSRLPRAPEANIACVCGVGGEACWGLGGRRCWGICPCSEGPESVGFLRVQGRDGRSQPCVLDMRQSLAWAVGMERSQDLSDPVQFTLEDVQASLPWPRGSPGSQQARVLFGCC